MRRNACQNIRNSLELEVKKGGLIYVSKPGGKWNSVAGEMLQPFVETGHLIITGASSLNRGFVKSKENRNTIHFNAESPNVELLIRIMHSAKSAQCLRSSFELEWTAQSCRG